ncbi:hypothetical protein TNCV_850751 [Trichonephila clavipes]|nr:hypothetical protein TNCV_850751 [Trichonephila clavipes]
MLGFSAMKEPTKNPSREQNRVNQKLPRSSEEQRASYPCTLTNYCHVPKNEEFWKAMGNWSLGPNPEEYTFTGLAWLLTRPDHSAAMPEWMATTCSNAMDSLNTRLMTSTVGTGSLGVKWSRSQAGALDK